VHEHDFLRLSMLCKDDDDDDDDDGSASDDKPKTASDRGTAIE
jgi:hypothetical protein